MQEKKRKTNK